MVEKIEVKKLIYYPKNGELIKQKSEFHDLFWTRQKISSNEVRFPLNKEQNTLAKKIMLRSIRTQRINFQNQNRKSKSLPHGFLLNTTQSFSQMTSPQQENFCNYPRKNQIQTLTFTQLTQKQKRNANNKAKNNSFSNSPRTRRNVSYSNPNQGLVRRRSCICECCGIMSNFQKRQQVYPSVIKYREQINIKTHNKNLEYDQRSPSQKINTPNQKIPTPQKQSTPIDSVHRYDENSPSKLKSKHYATVEVISTREDDQYLNLQMLIIKQGSQQKVKKKINIQKMMSSVTVNGFQQEKSKTLVRSENFSKQILVNKTNENNGNLMIDSKNRGFLETQKTQGEDKQNQLNYKLYRLEPLASHKKNQSQFDIGSANYSTYSNGPIIYKKRSNISLDSFDNSNFLPYHFKTKQSSPAKNDKNSRQSSYIQLNKKLIINLYSQKKSTKL